MRPHGQGRAPPKGPPRAVAGGRLCPVGLPSGSPSDWYFVVANKKFPVNFQRNPRIFPEVNFGNKKTAKTGNWRWVYMQWYFSERHLNFLRCLGRVKIVLYAVIFFWQIWVFIVQFEYYLGKILGYGLNNCNSKQRSMHPIVLTKLANHRESERIFKC